VAQAPEPVARARLYGEPLLQWPTELYIPPEALEVFLQAFEGPLDLLLYLIRKQHFNILDIPMAELTRQYLGYVEQVRTHNLELAGEYLLMAALLIEIKSRLLLPPRRSAPEAEAQDPRAELVRRLLEYERVKLAAQQLDRLPQLGRDFWRPQVQVPRTARARWSAPAPSDLAAAWQALRQRALLLRQHSVAAEPLSVRETMARLLRRLQGCRFLEFAELLPQRPSNALLILTLLATLELAREALIDLTQAEAYAPLYLRLHPSAPATHPRHEPLRPELEL